MSKPKVAIFDFACCEGCQLQIVNMEEELLDLLTVIDPVQWREGMSDQSDEYDIAIVEGSITREEDEEPLKLIRERAKILVALGACATIGGINKMKDAFDLDEVKESVYGKDAGMPHLATAPVKAVHEVVKVDYPVHGCPIRVEEFAYILRCLLAGREPAIPRYPVCVECKLRENACCYEFNKLCLGPITRAGCNAHCPSEGFHCFGCRGYVEDPNVNAAKEVMDQYGKTVEDLREKMQLFGTRQEFTL